MSIDTDIFWAVRYTIRYDLSRFVLLIVYLLQHANPSRLLNKPLIILQPPGFIDFIMRDDQILPGLTAIG